MHGNTCACDDQVMVCVCVVVDPNIRPTHMPTCNKNGYAYVYTNMYKRTTIFKYLSLLKMLTCAENVTIPLPFVL